MNTFDITRWILTVLFGLFWLLCAISNIVSSLDAARRHDSTSLILLFGGISGVIAVFVCPIPGLWIWCWVPALLDIGTLPALATIIYGTFTKTKWPQCLTIQLGETLCCLYCGLWQSLQFICQLLILNHIETYRWGGEERKRQSHGYNLELYPWDCRDQVKK